MPYSDFTEQEKLVEKGLNELGFRFEMQTQIGRYIVDFLVENQIVIEADGGLGHLKKADKKRDKELREMGVKEIFHVRAQTYGKILERLKEVLCQEEWEE